MFDYHLHSSVSFDSDGVAEDMALTAAKLGLKEICFTDHYDYDYYPEKSGNLFNLEQYSEVYDSVKADGVLIKRGVEFGLTKWNKPQLDQLLAKLPFDFVIGSVHFADGYDPYFKEYWQGKTVEQAFLKYLEETLTCVKAHDSFDVLGHLTYVCKSAHNTDRRVLEYDRYSDIVDEILKEIVSKGIGIEVNTSGMSNLNCFLPSEKFVRRFKELGGEIVTVGSDAHDAARVGQHVGAAIEMLKDIFGYVCTFEQRKPIFHKL